MLLGGHLLFTCSDTFAVGCFATRHTAHITDKWTDRWHYHSNGHYAPCSRSTIG